VVEDMKERKKERIVKKLGLMMGHCAFIDGKRGGYYG